MKSKSPRFNIPDVSIGKHLFPDNLIIINMVILALISLVVSLHFIYGKDWLGYISIAMLFSGFALDSACLKRIRNLEHPNALNSNMKATTHAGYDYSARPIWEVVADTGKTIPDEEWEKLPRDLSVNLDHYLYGAPKRPQ